MFKKMKRFNKRKSLTMQCQLKVQFLVQPWSKYREDIPLYEKNTRIVTQCDVDLMLMTSHIFWGCISFVDFFTVK